MPFRLMISELSTSYKYCLRKSRQMWKVEKEGESQCCAEVDYTYGDASHVQLAPYNWFLTYPQPMNARKGSQEYLRTNQINFRSWKSEKFHQGEYL